MEIHANGPVLDRVLLQLIERLQVRVILVSALDAAAEILLQPTGTRQSMPPYLTVRACCKCRKDAEVCDMTKSSYVSQPSTCIWRMSGGIENSNAQTSSARIPSLTWNQVLGWIKMVGLASSRRATSLDSPGSPKT